MVENAGRGEAVCLTGEGFTLYLAADGSAAYGVEQVNGADLLLLRPRPAPDPLTEQDREVGIAALSLNTQMINGDPAWEEFYRARRTLSFSNTPIPHRRNGKRKTGPSLEQNSSGSPVRTAYQRH